MRTTRLDRMRRRFGVTAQTKQGTWTMLRSTALVPTDKGSRYLQQLCKHWSHNLKVEFTEAAGKVVFPKNARGADWPSDAVLTLHAHAERLECRLEASIDTQLQALKDVVARHLDRFAFREAPLTFDWQDA